MKICTCPYILFSHLVCRGFVLVSKLFTKLNTQSHTEFSVTLNRVLNSSHLFFLDVLFPITADGKTWWGPLFSISFQILKPLSVSKKSWFPHQVFFFQYNLPNYSLKLIFKVSPNRCFQFCFWPNRDNHETWVILQSFF